MIKIFNFIWNHPLNENARLSAIWRFFRWQVGSRFLPGLIALPFVNGTQLFAKRGMAGATGNWYCGLHEASEMGFCLHALLPTDLFLDVGANIGSYSVLAAGAVGAHVVAFEPIPSTFRHLQRNILLNGLGDKVRCEQIGLSDRAAVLRFTDGLDTVNHVLADQGRDQGIAVPVKTLDQAIGDNIPAIIKIDVEGHELAVLNGASKILKDTRLLAVIMETNGSGIRYDISDDALFKIMQGYGFESYIYDPMTRSIRSDKGNNTIFIRDFSTVNERVQRAKIYDLVNGKI